MLVGKGTEVGELTSQEVYDVSAKALSEVSDLHIEFQKPTTRLPWH